MPRAIRNDSSRGMTLIELMIISVISAIFILVLVKLAFESWRYYSRYQIRSSASVQARACLDTIQRFLTNGAASTVVVTNSTHFSAPVTSSPPSSEIKFSTDTVSGSTVYDIYWKSGPDGPPDSVWMDVTFGTQKTTSLLATYITGLSFTWQATDAGLIDINLQVTAPLEQTEDAAGNYLSAFRLTLNRTVRLIRQ